MFACHVCLQEFSRFEFAAANCAYFEAFLFLDDGIVRLRVFVVFGDVDAVCVLFVDLQEVPTAEFFLADITFHAALVLMIIHVNAMHLNHVGLHEILIAEFFVADLTITPARAGRLRPFQFLLPLYLHTDSRQKCGFIHWLCLSLNAMCGLHMLLQKELSVEIFIANTANRLRILSRRIRGLAGAIGQWRP